MAKYAKFIDGSGKFYRGIAQLPTKNVQLKRKFRSATKAQEYALGFEKRVIA